MAIVKRLDKGSALTYAELDGNFDHLTAADTVQTALINTAQTTVDNHIADTTGAHADSAITFTPTETGAVSSTVGLKLNTLISSDDYNTATNSRAAALALSDGGFWEDQTPKGRVWRIADRLFVGDAATEGGSKKVPNTEKSWVGDSASGNMTYFDSRSQMAVYNSVGGVAGAFASRSSDNDRTGESGTIAVGGFSLNDNTNASDKKSCWAIYGHAAQTAANKFTTALELDTCSTQTLVNVDPYLMGDTGSTCAAWVGVGGETAQGLVTAELGETLTNVSSAISIVNTAATAAGNRFAKGIVFQATAIDGTDGTTGTGVAIQMAMGHEITWKYSSGVNAFGGKIRSSNDDATKQIRQVFTDEGLKFFGVNADLTTEVEVFRIIPVASAANYLTVTPTVAGGSPKLQTYGSDTNIDLKLAAKGTGVILIDYLTIVASTPSNFAANRYLKIKDSSGNPYYIPCMGTTW